MLKDGEHIEFINNELQLIVSKEHTFGTDALLLADFSKPSKNAVACDFGTGCGIIPFYWKRENAGKIIYGVELQEKGYDQLRRSAELNGIGNIIPINSDLKELKGKLPFGQFDVVSMNPPYTKSGGGIVSREESAKIARHEIKCTFEDICMSAARLLKFGGRLCMCIRPERMCQLIYAMNKSKIEPKRIRFVTQRPGQSPWLVLMEGKLGRKSGLTVEPELYIENEKGEISGEMLRIIGTYRKE